MKAIYIESLKRTPFPQWILDGLKTIETRSTNSLAKLIGERVAIIQTSSKGPSVIVGYVDITGLKYYHNTNDFDRDFAAHMVNDKSKYHISKAKYHKKYGYTLANPISCEPFPVPSSAIRHGYTWCEF